MDRVPLKLFDDKFEYLCFMQSGKYGQKEGWEDVLSFVVETLETAVKSWHDTSKVDPRVYFLLDKEKTDTENYAPVVNIDKVLGSISIFSLRVI